jgi:hypothetical protein
MENKAYNKQNDEMKAGGYMLKMIDLYKKHLRGETFKGLSEMNLGYFPIKNPADLAGASPELQHIVKKHLMQRQS